LAILRERSISESRRQAPITNSAVIGFRPGKLLAWAKEQLAASPAQLPDRIGEAFGVRVHPRSVERALARRRGRHSKGRGTARPPDAEGG
jgi:hypothetical protein